MDDPEHQILPEIQQETQEETQPTQLVDQESQQPVDESLWGFLQPCNQQNIAIKFYRNLPRYRFGRNGTLNDIILPGFKVSNQHCVITWDGELSNKACVTVTDNSSNGTFINASKIGRGNTRILREGNEIAFGTSLPQSNSVEDYRFIFRLVAGGEPREGLYAEYDIMYELGKGSFATVMKGLERRTGIARAIKMIHNRTTGSPQDEEARQKQLVREIEIMKALTHPNICGLLKVFPGDDGGLNLVLELVNGGDLLDYIIKNDGVDERTAKHLSYQMCDALAYVHSKNIAHRDLKPENILITNSNPPQVKIADFGLAKVADSVTMLRTMCGTPSYLAPEVVTQDGITGYGNVVDAWSLGVIIFSMISNAAPFIEDENIQDIRQRIVSREIYWDPIFQRGISDEGYDFIRCLLLTDPTLRMTLSEALSHTWFADYEPCLDTTDYPDYKPPSERYTNITTKFASMNVDHGRPTLSGTPGAGISIQPSGLIRRSKVVLEASDKDERLPSPPEEMVANWEREDEQQGEDIPTQAPPSQVNGHGKRSFSPVREPEGNGDVEMDVASPRKKPRQSQESSSGSDEGPDLPKGKPAKVPRGKRQQQLMDQVVPRRSGRNARPVAR